MILARRAEAMFWAGRYLERAQQTTRVVDVTYHAVLEEPRQELEAEWYEVLRCLGVDLAYERAHAGEEPVPIDAERVLRFLVDDPDQPSSIRSCVAATRENVRSVREQVSDEYWTAVNDLYLQLQSRDVESDLRSEPYELLAMVRRWIQHISGAASDTMLRDEGYAFLVLGRHLERAAAMNHLIDVRLGHLVDHEGAGPSFHHWATVLRSAGALEAYRRVNGHSMDLRDVVAFLLLSDRHPRSVLFCLRACEAQLDLLGQGGRAARRMGRARASLDYRTAEEVLDRGLHEFLGDVASAIAETADLVASEFFQYLPTGPVTTVASR